MSDLGKAITVQDAQMNQLKATVRQVLAGWSHEERAAFDDFMRVIIYEMGEAEDARRDKEGRLTVLAFSLARIAYWEVVQQLVRESADGTTDAL